MILNLIARFMPASNGKRSAALVRKARKAIDMKRNALRGCAKHGRFEYDCPACLAQHVDRSRVIPTRRLRVVAR